MLAALPAWMAQQDAAAVETLRTKEAAAHDALTAAQGELQTEQQGVESQLAARA